MIEEISKESKELSFKLLIIKIENWDFSLSPIFELKENIFSILNQALSFIKIYEKYSAKIHQLKREIHQEFENLNKIVN